jgi:hypothetical protein
MTLHTVWIAEFYVLSFPVYLKTFSLAAGSIFLAALVAVLINPDIPYVCIAKKA